MELRKDYILDRWVIISESRGKRPQDFKTEPQKKQGTCFFCPGNEDKTPPEIGRFPNQGNWKFRWFENKFSATKKEGQPKIETHNEFFTFSSAYGFHEVIVDTPSHKLQQWDLPCSDLLELLQVYQNRIDNISKIPYIEYVSLFKNHGKDAGTSLVHSHVQAIGSNIVPKQVRDEAALCKEDCPYCRIIDIEKQSDRRCFENDSMVAFTPYASRFNYEVWIFPKKHIRTLNDMTKEDFANMAEMLHKVLCKLKSINASYNYFIHYSPDKDNLHLHIEICPRLANWAGFEFASGIIINSVSPELAAEFYRT